MQSRLRRQQIVRRKWILPRHGLSKCGKLPIVKRLRIVSARFGDFISCSAASLREALAAVGSR